MVAKHQSCTTEIIQMTLNGSAAQAQDRGHAVDRWPAPTPRVCMIHQAKICWQYMKPESCFSELWNKILSLWNSVELLALPHHASPFGLCGGSLWYTSPKRWISAKDTVHRFFYAFFKGFTLAELITRRSFPQHLVVYPQIYQHVDNRPRKRIDQGAKILRHQDRF
jgi:hypothetical protein